MEELIFRCADLHVKHISGYGDPFETGSSRPLDFGHWSAHRLEHLTDYQLRHGEAVAVGISLDVCYAAEISLIPGSLRDRVLSLFRSLSLPVYHKYLGDEKGMNNEVYSGLVEFQEHLGGVLTITLIEDIGIARDVHEVSRQDYDRAVAFLKHGK
jgi:3-dehydroquinate synthase